MMNHMAASENMGMLWQPLSNIYIWAWTGSSMRLNDGIMDLIGTNGCREEEAKKKWMAGLDKYWINLNSHTVQESSHTLQDSDNIIDLFKCSMPNKLEWVKSQELFPEYHPFIKQLLIMNKYSFSAIQHLFYNDSKKNLHLEFIILEVHEARDQSTTFSD
jgi:hypothetical protein